MKHIKFKADVSNWDLDSIDNLAESIGLALRTAVEEVLQLAFEDDETHVYFPVEWSKEPDDETAGCDGIGGPEVADPLTVYLRVAIGDGEKPTFAFNLRRALQDSIDACAQDGSFAAGLGRLSISLRQLADDIDAARAKSNAGVNPRREAASD